MKKDPSNFGISTVSVYQVQITGMHHSHKGMRSGSSNYIPKSKIELLCADKDKDKIIGTTKNCKYGPKR